jgi:hypothetical protein
VLKGRGVLNGKDTFVIGLSFGNLDKFRAGPCDSFIHIDGIEHELPFDIVIFSGETEAAMAEMLSIGPNTRIIIDNKFKH